MQLSESWRLLPSPARGLHAAAAWLQAGGPDSARGLLAAVSARGLSGTAAISAESLAARIERLRRH